MAELSSVGTPAHRASLGVERAAERRGNTTTGRAQDENPVRRGEDRVEISRAALRGTDAAKSEELPVRHELVERVRAQIAAGTYDSETRINGAIDALLSGSVLDAAA